MPQFDLRHITVAEYQNNNGAITYGTQIAAGDAMTAVLELRFAEGRLYAESSLAEFIRKAVGGNISLGVKYIKSAAQMLLFGSAEKSHEITYTPTASTSETTVSVAGLALGAKSSGKYVGVTFYCPDMVDGVEKFTCIFAHKARFGHPGYNNLQTAGENIQFSTPTTSGEFMADDSTEGLMFEAATVDDEAAAIAWCAAVMPAPATEAEVVEETPSGTG